MIIESLTLFMGIMTTMFSIFSAEKFYRCKQPISKAIAWTLVGEGFMGLMTTVFAGFELLDLIKDLPAGVATAMRVSMFSLASITTGCLVRQLHKVQND